MGNFWSSDFLKIQYTCHPWDPHFLWTNFFYVVNVHCIRIPTWNMNALYICSVYYCITNVFIYIYFILNLYIYIHISSHLHILIDIFRVSRCFTFSIPKFFGNSRYDCSSNLSMTFPFCMEDIDLPKGSPTRWEPARHKVPSKSLLGRLKSWSPWEARRPWRFETVTTGLEGQGFNNWKLLTRLVFGVKCERNWNGRDFGQSFWTHVCEWMWWMCRVDVMFIFWFQDQVPVFSWVFIGVETPSRERLCEPNLRLWVVRAQDHVRAFVLNLLHVSVYFWWNDKFYVHPLVPPPYLPLSPGRVCITYCDTHGSHWASYGHEFPRWNGRKLFWACAWFWSFFI